MSEDGKHNHKIATDIVRLRSVDASETNDMDQIAMCKWASMVFDKDVWHFNSLLRLVFHQTWNLQA